MVAGGRGIAARARTAAMMRLGAVVMRDHVLGDPVLTARHGFSVARRGGLWCFASTKLDAAVFNHVSGYGTFAEPTQRAVDAVRRHYDSLGRVPRIEVVLPDVSRAERALLERNGFRDARTLFQCHLRTTTRPPRRHEIPGVTVSRVTAAEAVTYATLATRGFGGRDAIARVFERGWIRQIRRDRRVAAFIGRVDGAPAATGVMIVRPVITGFYSGSVLPRFRGRGLQNAMIATRLRYGWDRGRRVFYSWTDPDSASARNLRDEGFVTGHEVHMYEGRG